MEAFKSTLDLVRNSVTIPVWGYYVAAAFAFLSALRWLRKEKIDFRGKHIVITGGSEGLGKASAVRFAREGAHVTIIARTQSKLDTAVAEIKKAASPSQKIQAISGDVTNPSGIALVISKAVSASGPIDYLISNAGTAHPGYFFELTPEDFKRQMELNYLGTINTVKAALPHMMAAKRGTIVFVSSAASMAGFIGYSAYTPTKFALRGLADCLRNELRLYGIQVRIFFPSAMKTPGYEREEQIKPEETKKIESLDPVFSEEDSAKTLLSGLKSGNYTFTQEFLAECGRIISNGVPPRGNFFLEVIFTPIIILVQSLYLFYIDYVVGSSKVGVRHLQSLQKKGN
eukprot:TRINITY_DN945_c0_g1_i1.p1 TRINITY_DN945_c0_g1~~TRINITY_DN945_c0_g1_i1.p1  ORF type:complete len:343 (-),score=83.18 TRINITY_DN945_c0_g1_i1:80-1108(-)